MEGGSNQNQPEYDEREESFEDDTVVSWEASEYVHHQKGLNWYLGLAGAVIIIGVLLFLITGGRDWYVLVAVVVTGVAVGVYAGRQPQVVRYRLGHSTISLGDKLFILDEFKSFYIAQEGGVQSITLMPVKRFMPPVSIYFPPQEEEIIVETLGQVLPLEEPSFDLVDQLMRRFRF